MVFSSLSFLYFFLPAVLLCFRLAPPRIRSGVLLFFSLFFYAWGDLGNLPLMLLSALLHYGAGLAVFRLRRGRKAVLAAAVLASAGALVYFKYWGMITGALHWDLFVPALPVGISFYTFQAISYTVDCYRGTIVPAKNPLYFFTYLTFFPQLIAGPIVRYEEIEKNVAAPAPCREAFDRGALRFVCGLCKKVLLANSLGWFFEALRGTGAPGLAGAWVGLLCFALQIYYDFSGYCDMAVGLGLCFGFSFPENFQYPYISASITEFWRRWHRTLSGWFRDYIYIPLGGSRCGQARTLLNLFIVWSLTGLWHGAAVHFWLWGIYYFLLLAAEKLGLLRFFTRRRVLGHCYTLLAVLLGWTLFCFDSLPETGRWLWAMADFRTLFTAESLPLLLRALPLLLIGAAGCTPLPARLRRPRWLDPVLCGLGLLVSTAFLVNAGYNPFLYFQF